MQRLLAGRVKVTSMPVFSDTHLDRRIASFSNVPEADAVATRNVAGTLAVSELLFVSTAASASFCACGVRGSATRR